MLLAEIESNGTKFQLNQEFLNVTFALSDEISIDENAAAELILNASDNFNRLSLVGIQGGIVSFHLRRQYILDLVRFLLSTSDEEYTDQLNTKFKSFVQRLVAPYKNESLLSRTLRDMKEIENTFVALQEKESRGTFLGQLESREFVETLKMRRDFLLSEHDALGQILTSLIEYDHVDLTKDIATIFTHVQSVDAYNTVLLHYIPAIAQIGLRLDPNQSVEPASLSFNDILKVKTIFKDEKAWKLQYWRGAVQLIYYTYAAGLHRTKSYEGENLKDVDFKTDILDPIKEAIDAGAFELLLFIASDINPSETQFEPFFDFRPQLQFYVSPYKSLGKLSENFLALLFTALERLAEAIITNTADILREMRLNEEDMYLANAQNEVYQDGEDPVGVDLERFFIFISCLYNGRPDAAIQFWSDTDNDLYGFIQWASQCDILIMSAAFSHMFASLASGPNCALAAHKFLSESTTSTSFPSRTKKVVLISWNHIFGTIKDTISRLKPPQPPPSSLILAKAKVIADIPDLDQFDILILTNYLNILSQVVTYSDEAREQLLSSDEIKLVNVLSEFLSFYTPLYGPILNIFAGLALTKTSKFKEQIWLSLDLWLFNTTIAFPQNEYLGANIPAKERFTKLLDTYPSVLGFTQLLETLLRRPENTDGLYSLPYPDKLGEKYRTPGIGPYVDYIINEVFYTAGSTDSLDKESQLSLQRRSVRFIRNCLDVLDSDITVLSTNTGINPDLIVKTPSFLYYLLAHPSAPAMSYLFSSKIYTVLISLASVGIDAISDLPEHHPTVEILLDSLSIIKSVFELQATFLDVVIKASKTSSETGITLSTHGLSSFEDVFLYNLSIISHLALYIGSTNIDLARLSLSLLGRISQSSQFCASSVSTTDSRIRGNRLLSIFETVDESTRIKEGLIEQIERSGDFYLSVETSEKLMLLKEEIIKFIIFNLSKDSRVPTIAHFLLGFKINSDSSLSLDSERGGLASEISLLRSILTIYEGSVAYMSSTSIEKLFTVVASRCGLLVQLLLQNPTSSYLVLDYLREYDFFLRLLDMEPIIELNASWNGLKFDDNNLFFVSESSNTLDEFFSHRASLLKCLSIEIHTAATSGSLSLVSRFTNSLINMDLKRLNTFGTSTATRILSYLDILEFNIPTIRSNEFEVVKIFGDQVVSHFFRKDNTFEDALAELKLLLRVKGLELVATKIISSLDDPEYVKSVGFVIELFTKMRVFAKLRTSQFEYLNSWAKLVLVLVNDSDLSSDVRSMFLLETFQGLIHKLEKYADSDVEYAERVASLLVSLFTMYQDDMASLVRGNEKTNVLSAYQKNSFDRTHLMFKTAILSILKPSSTSGFRSELYVISYKYLGVILENSSSDSDAPSPAIRSCIQVVRASGDRLVEAICDDAINGEGNVRVTALVLLGVLCNLSRRAHSTFLLDSLIKYNLLLLLVQSIARYDSVLLQRGATNSSALFHELMAYKATMSFLLQAARTRQGAAQIIQCGLFNLLKSSQILRIDPDVGVDVPLLMEISANISKGLIAAGRPVDIISVEEVEEPVANGAIIISGAKNHGDSINDNSANNDHSAADPQSTFYSIVAPLFQLVSAVLLSMGSENEPVRARVAGFLQDHELLVVALLRKEVLSAAALDEQQQQNLDILFQPPQQQLSLHQQQQQLLKRNAKLELLVKHVVLLVSLSSQPGI